MLPVHYCFRVPFVSCVLAALSWMAYSATCFSQQVLIAPAQVAVPAGLPLQPTLVTTAPQAGVLPTAAPVTPGPAVTTVQGERLSVLPTGLTEGKWLLPGEPARQIPLDEIDTIEFGNAPQLAVHWVGQDQRDLVGVGAATGASGFQDIHLSLSGLPGNRQIRQVVVTASLPRPPTTAAAAAPAANAPAPPANAPAAVATLAAPNTLAAPEDAAAPPAAPEATPSTVQGVPPVEPAASAGRMNWAVWRLDPAQSPAWRLAVERSEGATSAEIYLEPPAHDAFSGEFTVLITWDDGSSHSLQTRADSHTNHQLKAGSATEDAPATGDGSLLAVAYGHFGAELHGQLLGLDDQAAAFRTLWKGEISLPAVELRAFKFGVALPGDASSRLAALLEKPPLQDTVLVLARDGSVSQLEGAVDGLSAGKLRINFEGQVRNINQSRLLALVLAGQPAPPAPSELYQVIRLTNGDQLLGTCLGLSAESLQVRPRWGGELSIPLIQLARLMTKNGKLAYLSDWEPLRVAEQAYFGRVFPYRRDAALVGGPLKLKGQEYAKGLAVHARCQLTYRLGGQYQLFKSQIGFDDATAGRGSVVCRLLGDGRELFVRSPLTATDELLRLEIPVEGVQELTLEIDFGEQEDTHDRVIWAEARVLRGVSGG